MSTLELRCGMALARGFLGPNRRKRVAKAIDCSLSMADYLMTGEKWTLERIEQVGAVLDWGVENWLPQPATAEEHEAEMIRGRILRAETQAAFVEAQRVVAESAALLGNNGNIACGWHGRRLGFATGTDTLVSVCCAGQSVCCIGGTVNRCGPSNGSGCDGESCGANVTVRLDEG